MSVYVFRVQSAAWCADSLPRRLSLGPLGQFACWSGSSLGSGDLGGPPSLLAGGGARRATRAVAHRLWRVRAHRLDVGDVEVGGVAPSPAAPAAASFAAGAAGVSPRLWKRNKRRQKQRNIVDWQCLVVDGQKSRSRLTSQRLVSRLQHGGADQGPLLARLKAFAWQVTRQAQLAALNWRDLQKTPPFRYSQTGAHGGGNSTGNTVQADRQAVKRLARSLFSRHSHIHAYTDYR